MLFSEMLAEIQGNGQEEQFYEQMRAQLKPITMEVPNWEYLIPILGKTMRAVSVLIDSTSIEDFKKTKEYRYIQDFELEGDFFSGEFDLLPAAGYKKVIANVVFVFLAIIEWFSSLNEKIQKK